jgi:hypothetical protein
VCDPACGEDANTCKTDCGSSGPVCDCGDGTCDPACGEDASSCKADCGSSGPVCDCGDGVCDASCGEDQNSCFSDCGQAPPILYSHEDRPAPTASLPDWSLLAGVATIGLTFAGLFVIARRS